MSLSCAGRRGQVQGEVVGKLLVGDVCGVQGQGRYDVETFLVYKGILVVGSCPVERSCASQSIGCQRQSFTYNS